MADSLAKLACYLNNIEPQKFNFTNWLTQAGKKSLSLDNEILSQWSESLSFQKFCENTAFVRNSIDELRIIATWPRKQVIEYLRILSRNCTDIPFKIKRRDSEICTCGYEKATIEHEL